MRRLWSILVLAALAALAALVAGTAGCGLAHAATGVERYKQNSESMEPTIKAGQVITARKVSGYKPRHGDIVLFHPPEKWSAVGGPYLKRVIAVGGEVIACCDSQGRVTVDNSPLDEPYVKNNASLELPASPMSCGPRKFAAVTVPPDNVFLMGDNREVSMDSRCEGPVPVASVFAVMAG